MKKKEALILNVPCFAGRISAGISCGHHTFTTDDFIEGELKKREFIYKLKNSRRINFVRRQVRCL